MNTLAERIGQLSSAQRAALRAKLNQPRREVELRAEAELDPAIIPAAIGPDLGGDPGAVFLTGGTGFLGAYLLDGLLRQTRAEVHCLVRAATPAAAKDKLCRILSRYGLAPADKLATRIVPVLGDLTEPRFGLGEIRFQALARNMDWVFHNGACVNFVYPYARLKPANVLGTLDAVRLACLERAKPLHYVSTLSIFGNEEPPGPYGFGEDDSVGPGADLGDGYAESKWVAERLVKAAAARGLPVAVYRPATLTGDSRTGAWNTDDLFCRLLKGCLELGAVPDLDIPFNLVPVDFTGQAIVHLARRTESLGHTFHLDSGAPISSRALIGWLAEFGYVLESLDFPTWKKRLHAAVSVCADHPLLPVMPMFDDPHLNEGKAQAVTMNRYDCRATLALLEHDGLSGPRIDPALMHRYLRRLVETGFLPDPGPGGASCRTSAFNHGN